MNIRDQEQAVGDTSFRQWITIGLFVSLGLFLWAHSTAPWPKHEEVREPVEKVAEAIFIAMVLALTVDLFLKKELAKDAFEASIGYVLPKYLRTELTAIYSNQIVCESHDQQVELSQIVQDGVRVKIRVERKLRNISAVEFTFNPSVHVDEWMFDSLESKIHELAYRTHSGETRTAQVDRVTASEGDVPRWTVELQPATLYPNEFVVVWYCIEETKRRNDVHAFNFRYATNNPRVRVIAPDDIGWTVEFTHRDAGSQARYSNVMELSGLLLPHQSITVRWWDAAKARQWRDSHRPGAIARS
jgi:hypothetical protein